MSDNARRADLEAHIESGFDAHAAVTAATRAALAAPLGRTGGLALALTTSGTSRNVLCGLEAARAAGLATAALAGKGIGELAGLADPLLIVPSDDSSRIQEMHITLGQLFSGALERRRGLS